MVLLGLERRDNQAAVYRQDEHNMPEDLSSSIIRVLVMGDHQRLCRAIKVGLKQFFEVEFVETLAAEDGAEDLDLVVVIALSATSGWWKGLPWTLPGGTTGQTPCLVIVEEDLEQGLDLEPFSVLPFPFTYDDLCEKVVEALSHVSQTAYSEEAAW
jgi:hypothetical protein